MGLGPETKAALRGRAIDGTALAAALGILGAFTVQPLRTEMANISEQVQEVKAQVIKFGLEPRLNATRLDRVEEQIRELRGETKELSARLLEQERRQL